MLYKPKIQFFRVAEIVNKLQVIIYQVIINTKSSYNFYLEIHQKQTGKQ